MYDDENTGAGKGDKRRPSGVSHDEYRASFDRIFGAKAKKKAARKRAVKKKTVNSKR